MRLCPWRLERTGGDPNPAGVAYARARVAAARSLTGKYGQLVQPGHPAQAGLPAGLGGAGGWSVAVQGALFVGAGGGGGAVGVQGEVPAPAVDGGEVVEGAEQDQVGQAGRTALAAGLEVVGLAGGGALAAAGEPAAAVAGDHGAAQVVGDGFGGLAHVQRQADT